MRPARRGIIFAHASQAYAWLLFCCTHCNCSTVPSGDYFEGPETKNRVRMQLFLRLRIVGWCQNADRGLKMQSTAAKRPFSALREWKRVRNRKKVAETSGFLFLRWAEIAVMRQTSRKYAKSATAATAATATATVRAEDQTPI